MVFYRRITQQILHSKFRYELNFKSLQLFHKLVRHDDILMHAMTSTVHRSFKRYDTLLSNCTMKKEENFGSC